MAKKKLTKEEISAQIELEGKNFQEVLKPIDKQRRALDRKRNKVWSAHEQRIVKLREEYAALDNNTEEGYAVIKLELATFGPAITMYAGSQPLKLSTKPWLAYPGHEILEYYIEWNGVVIDQWHLTETARSYSVQVIKEKEGYSGVNTLAQASDLNDSPYNRNIIFFLPNDKVDEFRNTLNNIIAASYPLKDLNFKLMLPLFKCGYGAEIKRLNIKVKDWQDMIKIFNNKDDVLWEANTWKLIPRKEDKI